ncbi:YaaA family protein [Schaalia sp. lx-260]|uniref:YaaA family protein n=1 Tax=Schaalia sp. lx-260 TaxID=2899082 RepID=UPI001E298EE9|nr:peroxide stress protein YaaA [Schaalia sp. lx-260]
MFIWLPPSEGKYVPENGPALDMQLLHAPVLTSARHHILHLYQQNMQDSARSVAFPSADIMNIPCARACEVYNGVLYQAASFASFDTDTQARVDRVIRIVSGLYGVVTPNNMIAPYKLPIQSRIGSSPVLSTYWKPFLDEALSQEAAESIIVDCRSGPYRKACPAPWAHTVEVTVVRESGTQRSIVSHEAKRWRGLLTGALIKHPHCDEVCDVIDLVDWIRDLLPSIHASDARGREYYAQSLEVGPTRTYSAGGSHRIATLVICERMN